MATCVPFNRRCIHDVSREFVDELLTNCAMIGMNNYVAAALLVHSVKRHVITVTVKHISQLGITLKKDICSAS